MVVRQYLSGLPEEVHNPDAAAAMFDNLTNDLVRALRMVLVIGLLILLGAWVVGPSESAARVRAGWDTLLGRASESGSDRPAGPLASSAAAHERGLLTGTAILGGLVWSRGATDRAGGSADRGRHPDGDGRHTAYWPKSLVGPMRVLRPMRWTSGSRCCEFQAADLSGQRAS